MRPRTWIALLVAIAAGWLAWLTTPWPRDMLTVPIPLVSGKYGLSTVFAITSDARFVVARVTVINDVAPNGAIADALVVWDRESNTSLVLEEKMRYGSCVLVSPDERLVCYVDGSPE